MNDFLVCVIFGEPFLAETAICHALKRHGEAIGGKIWIETLQKGEIWHKMENDCS